MDDILNQLKVIEEVPHFFYDEDSDVAGRTISLNELKEVLRSFQKDKSPGPNGWTHELFSFFFDLMGQDLLNAVEESKIFGFVNGDLNATFVTLVQKQSKPKSFDEFRPIALCNFAYKVISNIISLRIKEKFYFCMSREQFGFINDSFIFYVVGLAQEGLHSSKAKKKVYLSGVRYESI